MNDHPTAHLAMTSSATRLLLLASALAGCANNSPKAWCTAAEECFVGDWDGYEECVEEEHEKILDAWLDDCRSEWWAFTKCRSDNATCSPDRDWYGISGTDACDDASWDFNVCTNWW
jgi:hypothetical protein